MSAEHNHPPRCCCARECNCDHSNGYHRDWCALRPCPACPEHSDHATPYTEQETTNG